MDTYRYLDHQAQEHTAYDHLYNHQERLVEYVLKNREVLHWNLQQANYSITGKYGQKYATKNKHDAFTRIDAAFNIIESGTFDLPVDEKTGELWEPGKHLFVESETLESNQRGYKALLLVKDGNPTKTECACVDWKGHSVKAGVPVLYMCKHLMVYWLLGSAWANLKVLDRYNKSIAVIKMELFG